MKEYDAINYVMIHNDKMNEIFKYKNYFSDISKKILTGIKYKISNNELVDNSVFNHVPQEYIDNVINSEAHLLDFETFMTELKKEFVKNSTKIIGSSNSVNEIEEELEKLKGIFAKTNKFEKISVDKLGYKFFENVDNKKNQKMIKTRNWVKFNKNIPLFKGDVTVIAGRPGMAKSCVALSLALELARTNNKVLFFSLEMAEEQIINRIMAQISGISISKLQDPKIVSEFREEEISKLQRAIKELGELKENLIIISGNASTTDILKQVQAEKPDCIIIDYVQLLKSAAKSNSRYEEVTNISIELKAIAMSERIHIIELAQLSREVEKRADKRPILSDLKESSQLDQDASCVVGLYRESYYNEEAADKYSMELGIIKNRNGITGILDFVFNGGIQRVYEKVE